MPPEEQYYATWFHDNGISEEVLVRGILIRPIVTAQIAAVQPLRAVTKLTVTTLFLSVAKVFVASVLTFLYSKVSSLEHVSILHHVASSETSRSDHEVKELLSVSDRTKIDRRNLFDNSIESSLRDCHSAVSAASSGSASGSTESSDHWFASAYCMN